VAKQHDNELMDQHNSNLDTFGSSHDRHSDIPPRYSLRLVFPSVISVFIVNIKSAWVLDPTNTPLQMVPAEQDIDNSKLATWNYGTVLEYLLVLLQLSPLCMSGCDDIANLEDAFISCGAVWIYSNILSSELYTNFIPLTTYPGTLFLWALRDSSGGCIARQNVTGA